jgi:hypothetical protein
MRASLSVGTNDVLSACVVEEDGPGDTIDDRGWPKIGSGVMREIVGAVEGEGIRKGGREPPICAGRHARWGQHPFLPDAHRRGADAVLSEDARRGGHLADDQRQIAAIRFRAQPTLHTSETKTTREMSVRHRRLLAGLDVLVAAKCIKRRSGNGIISERSCIWGRHPGDLSRLRPSL